MFLFGNWQEKDGHSLVSKMELCYYNLAMDVAMLDCEDKWLLPSEIHKS